MPTAGIQIEGLRELRAGLKLIDDRLPREMRAAWIEVARAALPRFRAAVPSRSGRWRSKITATATQRRASISWGKASVPYAPWVEFGGTVRGAGRARNVTLVRPFRRGGRYIHPAAEQTDPHMVAVAERMLDQLTRKAGFQ